MKYQKQFEALVNSRKFDELSTPYDKYVAAFKLGLEISSEDEEATLVVFRTFNDKYQDAIALFPEHVTYPNGDCESYQHLGQHGTANYNHCISMSRPSTEKEIQILKRELESIGYNLKIRKRYVRTRG